MKELKTITTEKGTYDSFPDQTAREELEQLKQRQETDPTVPAWAKQPEKPAYTAEEIGLGNVANERQYSAQNPPPYPVESVNGKSGKVDLRAADVGARPDDWMPTAAEVGARPDNWMPTAAEVGALPSTYTPPNQTAEQVGADPAGTADNRVAEHNVDTDAHNDIRLELKAISERLTAFFDSDDQTLDELSEIVAYIQSNKTLIEAVTTGKVNVSDIIDNLTTNVANKPLSAAQGVALKALIDGLDGDKLDASELTAAINTALAQAKASGEFDGASVSVSSVSESTEDGGSNVVEFSDGKKLTVKNGQTGATGPAGADGKTPVKGTDYYTEADKTEMVNAVIAALPTWNGGSY